MTEEQKAVIEAAKRCSETGFVDDYGHWGVPDSKLAVLFDAIAALAKAEQ